MFNRFRGEKCKDRSYVSKKFSVYLEHMYSRIQMEDYEPLKILNSVNKICGKKWVKTLLCTKYFALECTKSKR